MYYYSQIIIIHIHYDFLAIVTLCPSVSPYVKDKYFATKYVAYKF